MARLVEGGIEYKFTYNLSKWANAEGLQVQSIKLNLAGRRGWPDRVVLWEGGHLVFIEFKQPGEAPRKLQDFIHELLTKMGFHVEVHDDANVALRSIQAQVRATTTPNQSDDIGCESIRV